MIYFKVVLQRCPSLNPSQDPQKNLPRPLNKSPRFSPGLHSQFSGTCIVLHRIALHCIALHRIASHCIALHCIALHCSVYFIGLQYNTFQYITSERMMVRWMCGVSLKDRKRSVDLYSLLGVQSVDVVVRRSRLRWFGHVERKSGDDWVSACRNVVVAGWDVRVEGGRLGMNVWRMIWRCLIYMLIGQCSGIYGEVSYREERLTLAERGRNGPFKNKWWWW